MTETPPPATGHLRPRTLPEILDGAVRHYRSRFLSLVVPFLPMALLDVVGALGIITVVIRWILEGGPGEVPPDLATVALWVLLLGLYAFARSGAFLFGLGATIFQSGGDLVGKPVTLSQAWDHTRRRIWALLGAGLLYVFATGIGFVLLVIPGLYLSVTLMFSAHVLLLEGTGAFDALSRSSQLVRGHFWRAVGLWVFLTAVNVALGTLSNVLSEAGNWLLDRDDTASTAWIALTAVSILVATVVSLVVTPLYSVVFTHFYWDIRVRKEALDLDTRLQQIPEES